jgi:hypothetical protein
MREVAQRLRREIAEEEECGNVRLAKEIKIHWEILSQ